MNTVQSLIDAMQRIAPLEYAEPWDKVGLQVGSPSRPLDGATLLTIDLTERVLEEAIGRRARAIVAYHPPIFEPLNRVTDRTPRQRIILGAAEAGIAIYSPHTALDAAPGGMTDWLCEGLSGGQGRVEGDCRALAPHGARDPEQEVKIVTFVPYADAEKVRNALASAGAGIIGAYRVCSFGVTGTGTFLAGEGAKPTVGAPGRLEEVSELRLEMVCSKRALPLAIDTLRKFHPYEEPAFDVYELLPRPLRGAGTGRRLTLDRPATMRELAQRLRGFLDRARIKVALVGEDRPIATLGVVPGSGGDLAALARREGCDAFITGEMTHHAVLGALHAGMSVLLAGHTNTERGYLPRLAERLRTMLPGVEIVVSTTDRDPLSEV